MTAKTADFSVLAIDGGGTHCRFALARGDSSHQRTTTEAHSTEVNNTEVNSGEINRNEVHSTDDRNKANNHGRIVVEAGPANATTDFDATVRCINHGLEILAQTTGVQLEDLHGMPAFVGLAGVTGPAIADQLKSTLPLRNARYTEDRIAALRGAFGNGDGLIAHCGTGSFFASQYKGTYRFAGGWGSVLGDEASAQWIGRKALSAALLQADDFLPDTALTALVFKRFGSTDEIIHFARTATPDDFGSLAPAVTEQAQRGDPNAQQIMQAGAKYIAQGIGKMNWQPGIAICFTGGIGPLYQPYLPDDIIANLAQPLGTPLDGALDLAFEHAETTHGHC